MMPEKAVDQFMFSSSGKPYSASYIDHVHQKVRDKLKFSKEFVVHPTRARMLL